MVMLVASLYCECKEMTGSGSHNILFNSTEDIGLFQCKIDFDFTE